jgi:hypothetical protein
MNHEIPRYEYNPDLDQQITLDYPVQETVRAPEEKPLAALGDLVLMTVMGGALTGGGTMPRTEALALEGLSATTEIPDRLAA